MSGGPRVQDLIGGLPGQVPVTGDDGVVIWAYPAGAPNFLAHQQILGGVVNNHNCAFTTDHEPIEGSLLIIKNATPLLLGEDYTTEGTGVTMTTAPESADGVTDRLFALYLYIP